MTMNIWITYLIIAAILLAAELLYFRIADRFNIIDKPNQRSSHTKVVIRGGGVIFAVGLWVWSAFFGFQYPWLLAFLLVYGVDGCCTILHRIMLHEHLGEAHRKHAYQLMANELGMSHVAVSLLYMALQLAISLAMVYLVPDTVLAHWIYLVAVALVLVCGYVVFMKKYYHLHAEYLESLKK